MKAVKISFLAMLLSWALFNPLYAGGGKEKQAGATATLPVTIMAISYVPEPPKPDAPVLLEMEKYTGVKVAVQWMPANGYDEKVAVTLASGSDMPMVMQVNNHKATNIVNAARAGVFWELSPYLKEFPNLSKLDPRRLENAAIDGKIYGMYRQRPVALNGVIYNRGWLEKLGLKEPTTIEELYTMFYAFAKKDPDGDGKHNTLGLMVACQGVSGYWMSGYSSMLAYFGGPNRWMWDGTQVIPEFMTKEYVDMLRFYKRLLDEGIMNSDFPVATWKKAREFMENEKAGAIMGFLSTAQELQSTARKINPKIVFDVFGTVKGPRGERTEGARGFDGQFVFLKPSLKNENMLKHAMKFFDKLSDKEMQNLVRWGFEGRHYVIEDGYRVRKPEFDLAFNMEVNPFRALKLHYDDLADPGKLSQPYARIREQYIRNEPFAVPNIAEPLVSQLFLERGIELERPVHDASVKFILGALDEAGFKQAIAAWESAGGRKIIEEYTAEYKRIKGIK